MDFKILRLYKLPLLFILSCTAFYISFGYDLNRTDFFKLIGIYAALFFLSFKLIKMLRHQLWMLASVAVLFRFLFIVSLPNLSQDYFRFIWDGRLLAAGWNPFLYQPELLIENAANPVTQADLLLKGMGSLSAGHFTSYPPVNQLIFGLAGLVAGKSILGSVIVMRVVIIAADLGVLYLGQKLLRNLNLPEHRIFWYILNPFIIIELTGNLHFEGVMVFFLLLSLYLLHLKKWIWSAIALGLSVSVKLLPLLFLPLFLKYFWKPKSFPNERGLNFQKLILYYVITISLVIVSFAPFISLELISNFSQTIGLWFQKFEFNASIYYIIREIGFLIKGYNIIETAGKVLPLITILILGGLAVFRKNYTIQKLITTMLLGVSVYFFLSTTVHPWYLATPLLLSIFTTYRYIIVWTAMVMLSYYSYSNLDYSENLWIISIEYAVVFGYLCWEFLNKPFYAKKLGNL